MEKRTHKATSKFGYSQGMNNECVREAFFLVANLEIHYFLSKLVSKKVSHCNFFKNATCDYSIVHLPMCMVIM